MGFQGAREFLEQGRDVEGGIMLAQGIHRLGELAGINRAVSSLLEGSAHCALTSIATQMERKAAQSLLGQMSKLGKFTEAPVLSTTFAAFNIYEDVERKSPLGYTNVTLDGAILLTGLAGPEMAPIPELDKQHRKDMKFIEELKSAESYFTITEDTQADGSGTVEKEHCFPTHCSVNDLVAGIGETHRIHLIEKSDTLLFFIHVHTRQKLPKGAKLTYSLSDYYYTLRGRDGQDAFYLGPQRSSVQWGNGQDLYFIPECGGVTNIDNHAEDGVTDWLLFNISFAQISATKSQQDLRLFFSNQHQVRVMNWFLGDEYRHMKFRSNDYITFAIGDATLNDWIKLQAVSLDFSPIEDKPETVDLSEVRWRSVISVVGTKHGDTIRGNDLGNVLQGGQGWAWQHIVFISDDFVMFQVSNTTSTPEIQPMLIDFSSRGSHVEFDLATFPGNQQIMTV
eukprot:g27632.t1